MLYNKVSKIPEDLSVMGIGCWNFGGDWDSSDDNNTKNIVSAAIDAGINFFDVAPVYGFHHSEEVLGNILKEENLRNRVFIASKCGIVWDNNRKTWFDLSRKNILREIDESLMRLKTDHIDLYQLHWPDPDTPVEETAEVLCELKKSGKIRYVGLSNFNVKDIETFSSIVEINSLQNLYNMLERNTGTYHDITLSYKTEEEILPYLETHGQLFLPYSPLFQGLLSGKFNPEKPFSKEDIRNENPKLQGDRLKEYMEIVNRLCQYADEYGKPLNEIAINWIRKKCASSTIIAGASSVEQLEGNLRCLSWDMDEKAMAEIEEIIKPVRFI